MRRALAVIAAILVSIIWLSIPVAAATAWLGYWQPQQYLPEELQTLPNLAGIDMGQLSGILDGSLIAREPNLEGEPDVMIVETATSTPDTPTPLPVTAVETSEPPTAEPTPESEAEIDVTPALTEAGDITSTVELTSTVDVTSTEDISATATVTTPRPSILLEPATVASIGNLRAGPGTDFDTLGTVDEGATVLIVAQDPTGEWFLLTDDTWISGDLLTEVPSMPIVEPTPLVGEAGTPDAAETPTPGETPVLAQTESVTVTTNSDANLRAGPATTFDVIDSASLGDVLTVVGMNEAGDWYLAATGGWISSTLVTGELPEGIPVVDEQGIILAGPNAGQTVISPEGETTPAAEETPEGEEIPEGEPTPAAEETDTPATTAEVTPAAAGQAETNVDANLRAGPDTTFEVLGSAPAGTQLTIVGRNSAGDWYQLADDSWIFATLVDNPPADVPVVEAP